MKMHFEISVRLPGDGRRRVEHVAEFQTTVRGLLALRDWLEAHRVERVAMEATGVYWKPVWAVLEDRFDCLLVNARHVKQVPGRKTDVKDAQWLASCLGGAAAGESGAAEADPDAPRPDALPQEPDPRPPARDEPAAQGHAGHRDQARLRRHRHDGPLRARDARRARVWHD